MILEHGEMFSMLGLSDLFLVSANAFVTADGRLVMGRGAALQLLKRMPGIDRTFGDRITPLSVYGLVIQPLDGLHSVGLFQVKFHWRDDAHIELVARSTQRLQEWCMEHPDSRVDMNFPAIGNGKLKRNTILPIIEPLPDTVHIWEYPS